MGLKYCSSQCTVQTRCCGISCDLYHTGTITCMQVISDIRGTEKLFRLPATPAKYGHFFQWIKGHRCCRKTIFMEGYTLLPLDHPLRPYLARLKSMVAGDTEYDPQSISVPTIRTHEQARAGKETPIRLNCQHCIVYDGASVVYMQLIS